MGLEISALTELTGGVSLTDLMVIVDVSDTTQASSGTTKKVTVGTYLISLGQGIQIVGFENYTIIKATGNVDETALEVGDFVEGVGAYFNGDYIIASVATAPVSDDSDFNTPIYRNASS